MLTAHFKRHELACHCCGLLVSNQALFIMLELCRLYVTSIDPQGYLTVNCSTRCKKHNSKVGGAKRSKHLKGQAADIVPHGKGVSLKGLYDFLIETFPNSCGISLYKTFVHIDVRKIKGRW